MSNPKPGRGADQFPLRLPEGMRDRIKEAAAKNGRSMNQEIVATLELFFPPEPPIEELLKEMKMTAELLEGSPDNKRVRHDFSQQLQNLRVMLMEEGVRARTAKGRGSK